MEFRLLGRKIDITNGKKQYLEVVNYYTEMADRAVAGFNSKVGNNLMNKYEENSFNYYFTAYVAETRKYLSQHGIYTVSESDILDTLTSENRGRTYLQKKFDEAFDEIVDNAPDYDSDDDRTWYIVKNSLKALDSGCFDTAIRIDIMGLCDFVVDCLIENDKSDIQVVYAENAKKAKAIYENLVSKNIPESDLPVQASSLIELDFSVGEYYEYIFNTIPEARFEIVAIANYIGVNLNTLIENEIKRTFNPQSVLCEEDALAMMSHLKHTMEQYGVTKSVRLTELEKMLLDFDIKARTYDGVRYETRELRAKAEADDKELYSLFASINDTTKEELLSFISQIDSMQCDEGIKNKHISLLQNKIREIEKAEMGGLIDGLDTASEAECNAMAEKIHAYPAVFAQKDIFTKRINEQINTIWKAELEAIIQDVDGMPEEACETAKQKIQAHNAPDEMKNEYIGSVEKRIYTIWDAEDFERFSELYNQTPVGDSAAVGKIGSLIQREGRTETKELFVKALYLLNENEVAAAAKYALAKESGMFASLLNMGKKESYMILTLNGRLTHPAIEEAMKAQKEAKGNGLLGGLGKLKNSFGFGKTNTSSADKFCANCGKPVDQGAKFCSSCGNKID